MRTWQALLVVTSACGLLVGLQEWRQRSAAARTQAELAALSASVEGVRVDAVTASRERRRLEQFVAASPAATKPPAPRGDDEQKSASAASAGPKPEAASTDEVSARAEASFRQETVDRGWATGAEQRISTQVGAVLGDPAALRSLECRDSLCRMETVHASDVDYRTFTQRALIGGTERIWDGGFFITKEGDAPDGKVMAVAYLVREGRDLPVQPD